MATRSDPRICLHTPGPYSETYYEQAYLARYLGFLLVEGADLVARDGLAHVRTIAGLKRADVIWRRIDSDFADPLELKGGSHLGVPGLVEAIRQGNVAVANALGSRRGRNPGAARFHAQPVAPAARRKAASCRPSPPGGAARRRSANTCWTASPIWPFRRPSAPRRLAACLSRSVVAGELSEEQREKLATSIRQRGADFIGQELVRLSTTPVWVDNKLEPRPFILRVYAALGPDGKYQVMPGGFCRISDRLDSRAVAMGQGVQTSDVWIVSNRPVEPTTLLPSGETVAIRRIMGNLPSRAADNLFWLGRYLERAEATLRLIRCLGAAHHRKRGHVAGRRGDHPAAAQIARRLGRGSRQTQGGADAAELPQRRAVQSRRIRLGRCAGARLAAHRLGHPRAPVGRHLAHHRRIGQGIGRHAPAARRTGNSRTRRPARFRPSPAFRVWRRRT